MIMLLSQCDTILQWFHIPIAIILYEPENYIIMNDFTCSFIPNVQKKKVSLVHKCLNYNWLFVI